jgi:syntaxin 16
LINGADTRSDSGEEGEGNLLKNASSNSSNWKAVKESLPPIWVDKIEQVEEDIVKIQTKIRELNVLHTKRLMVNFETDEQQQEREIDDKTHEITSVFHHAETVLKKFGKQADDPTLSLAEKTVRKNMQMSMAKRLQGLTTSFRSTQKEYLIRMQNQKQGGGSQAFDFLTDSPAKKMNRDDMDTGFTTAQMQVLDNTDELVNQRDEEITRIAQSIEELASIFKELAVLIIDQGTILDRIDYNMENAVEYAKEGIVQLVQAEEHQKSAMSVRIIACLVVLIVVMLVVLVLKHSK